MIPTRVALAASIGAGILFLPPAAASSAEWHVNAEGTGDFPTIQAAIDSASVGDKILLAPGIYRDSVQRELNGATTTAVAFLRSGIRLVGEMGEHETFIDGEEDHHCLVGEDLDDHTVIRALTLLHGDALGSTPVDGHGGGMLLYRSAAQLDGIRFVGCNAALGGGGLHVEDGRDGEELTLRNSAFIYCYSGGRGGGANLLKLQGKAQLQGNTFAGNFSEEGGGGFSLHATTAVLENNVFWLNCSHLGGGPFACESGSDLKPECNVFWDNVPAADQPVGGGCELLIGEDGNLIADPLFCDFGAENFAVDAASPAAAANSSGCGLIGAYDVSCGDDEDARVVGFVTLGDSHVGIPGVALSIEGAPGVTTGADGRFIVEGVAPGDPITIRPWFSEPLGSALSSLDVSLTLCQARGLEDLEDTQRAAADWTGDGRVTTEDALAILDEVVAPGPAASWSFWPESQTVATGDGTLAGVDFRALLRGDVSESWRAASGGLRSEEPEWEAVGRWHGSTYELTITVQEPARALDFFVVYDPGVLSWVDAAPPVASHRAVRKLPGWSRVAVASAEPWAAGEAITVRFEAGVGRMATVITVGDVRIDEIPAGDTAVLVPGFGAEIGELAVQATPNPSRGNVQLALAGVGETGAVVEIYDVAGRRLRELGGGTDVATGTRVVAWDGRDESGLRVSAGLYFARVRAGDRTTVARIVMLR